MSRLRTLGLLGLGVLGGLLASSPAQAHTRPDTRRALLQITPTHVEMVVHWRMPDGVEAGTIRARLDGNGDRRLTLKVERLGQAQMLMPRLQKGLTVWLDGTQLTFEVAQMAFKDAEWIGPRTGFEALVLFRAPLVLRERRTVVLAVSDGPPVIVEAQGLGVPLESADLPTRAGDPVLGPATVGAGRPQVTVQIRPAPPRVAPAAGAPGSAAPTSAPQLGGSQSPMRKSRP